MPTSRKDAPRDENRVPTLIGVASETTGDFIKDVTPVPIAINPVTKALQVEAA